jgi:hypothetical protein
MASKIKKILPIYLLIQISLTLTKAIQLDNFEKNKIQD